MVFSHTCSEALGLLPHSWLAGRSVVEIEEWDFRLVLQVVVKKRIAAEALGTLSNYHIINNCTL